MTCVCFHENMHGTRLTCPICKCMNIKANTLEAYCACGNLQQQTIIKKEWKKLLQ